MSHLTWKDKKVKILACSPEDEAQDGVEVNSVFEFETAR